MLSRLKRMLGLVPSEEQWDTWKGEALARLLGKQHDMVMHAIIPFAIGGGLDLYYFPQREGFAIATMELIAPDGSGPRNRLFRAYELAMFARVPFDLELAKDEATPMGRMHRRMNGVLNAMARYAPQATLNPHETMEFPADFSPTLGGQCLILDCWRPGGQDLVIGGKPFGLMVPIVIHRSEMEFARSEGGERLLAKLKERGHWPYSDLEREPVA